MIVGVTKRRRRLVGKKIRAEWEIFLNQAAKNKLWLSASTYVSNTKPNEEIEQKLKANALVKAGATNDQRWINLETVGAKRGARKVLAKLWPKKR